MLVNQNTQLIENMGFEFAMLHGELHRLYTSYENHVDKTRQSGYATEIGTCGDRLVHGMLVLALAALPALKKVCDPFYASGDGVFVYDHLEAPTKPKWPFGTQIDRVCLTKWGEDLLKADESLASCLFAALTDHEWLELAENNRAPKRLEGIVHAWGMEYVEQYAAAQPTLELESKGGLFSLWHWGTDPDEGWSIRNNYGEGPMAVGLSYNEACRAFTAIQLVK